MLEKSKTKLNIIKGVKNSGGTHPFDLARAKVLLREVSPLSYTHHAKDNPQFRSSNFRHVQSSATQRCIFLCVCAYVDCYLYVDQLAFQSNSNPHLQSALRF